MSSDTETKPRPRVARARSTAPAPARPQPRRAAPPSVRPPQQDAPERGILGSRPRSAAARTPFLLFVLGLLGGGLICLLVINTVLASGSYRINSLQQAETTRQQQVQVLQQQVAADSAPSVIARRARQLGMVAPPLTKFLNLRTGRIIGQPTSEPGVLPVPGYVP